MKSKTLVRMIERMGFTLIRSNKHDIYSNGSVTVILPQHSTISRPMAKQTLKLISYPENVCEINYKVNQLKAA